MTEELSWLQQSKITGSAQEFSNRCLEAYRANPDLVEEHFAIEREIAEGGYGRRQIYELVQNGADEILRAGVGARIAVVLSSAYLYCANEGSPIDRDGLRAILGAHRSGKRGNEIGRFGLGFKSVLAVTDAPEFFSRSGSFRFDPTESGKRIREVVPNTTRVPRLRMSFPIDPFAAAADDDILDELMQWATTVVRLPLNQDGARSIPADVESFPSEFVLFSQHVRRLTLENRSSGYERTISADRDGELIHLQVTTGDSTEESTWRAFSTDYKITEEARRSAGELADRDRLPLVWAVPTSSTTARGEFWAFFPTHYKTTLRGILNAPWKTNADRQNLLESEFNTELIGVAADLVIEHLRDVQDAEDPGRYLDFLPGRGREAPQWADELVTRLIWEKAAAVPSIADLNGVLRLPGEISLPPSGVSREAMELFASIPGVSPDWAHPSLLTRERRPRIERLLEEHDGGPATWSRFMTAAVESGTPEASLAALRLGLHLTAEQEIGWRMGACLLTEAGRWVRPIGNAVFLPGEHPPTDDSVDIVHPDLLRLNGARDVLAALDIGLLDTAAQLEHLLANSFHMSAADNELCWTLARSVPPGDALRILQNHRRQLRVKTLDGSFRQLQQVLLPGAVVPADGSRDAHAAVDTSFHAPDLQLIEGLGVGSEFSITLSINRDDDWYHQYRNSAYDAFVAQPSNGRRRPQTASLDIQPTAVLSPLGVVEGLSSEGRLEFMRMAAIHARVLGPWNISHRSNKSYLPLDFPNPVWWLIGQEGLIETSLGITAVSEAVGPELERYLRLLPVARMDPSAARQLGLPSTLDELSADHWSFAYDISAETGGAEGLGQVLELAFNAGAAVPVQLPSPIAHDVEHVPLTDLFVVTSVHDSDILKRTSTPHVLVRDSETAEHLIEEWGLKRGDAEVDSQPRPVNEVYEGQAVDLFPGLALALGDNRGLRLYRCEQLVVDERTPQGLTSQFRDKHLEDLDLYVADDAPTPEVFLRAIDTVLGLGLTADEINTLLDERARQSSSGTRSAVESEDDLAGKILLAIGESALRKSVPQQLLGLVENDEKVDGRALAELALAVHGVEILQKHRNELAEHGLNPPPQWAGRDRERRWAMDLGFPPEFAGFPNEDRDPILAVPGRKVLPELHDYQLEVVDGIRHMLEQGYGRAFVSLPTGAGKTRVATHGIADGINSGLVRGPVLWIAQTDELCEQAVRTWADTWLSMGDDRELLIGRLWSTNEVKQLNGQQVIVATIAKMEVIFDKPEYEWLSKASVVVIDEGHRALSPAYTKLLDWLGMGGGKDRAPLFGLSATPFRGNSERETDRLAKRFGNNRLDRLGANPYDELQRRGVLAHVDHELLTGADIELSRAELDDLQRTKRVPASVENRLGNDADRNNAIVESVCGLDEDKTVLLFAASVSHAEYLAGLLSHLGVPSKAISAGTSAGARRHYVKQFRSGDIRVLTNYGVLAEGFDAPSVDAVYVTRPTYSPNVYQQMIGRGLRGPKNGGKERCLIVNVADTFAEFGEKLAFLDFEYLWNR
jgi:superfamily II DNA or RNA helicase